MGYKANSYAYTLGAMSIIFGGINSQALAAETARITLPLLLSPDDASTQPKTTVKPMLDAPIDILGPRRVSFQSTANVSAEVKVGKKGREITFSPSDVLLEYALEGSDQRFSAYCKAYPQKPLAGLACLSDRDHNGSFDQFWVGQSANPKIGIPMPLAQLQPAIISQAYSVRKGPIASELQFGFSVTSAGGLANKREIHLQVTNGSEKVYMFYNRISGPGRSGPVDAKIFDSEIRLYGEDSKTVTYSIEKPFSQPSYNVFHPGISTTVWIYVPG